MRITFENFSQKQLDAVIKTVIFAPKYETSSDIVTNKKNGSIEPKKERVPNNTIFYIQPLKI